MSGLPYWDFAKRQILFSPKKVGNAFPIHDRLYNSIGKAQDSGLEGSDFSRTYGKSFGSMHRPWNGLWAVVFGAAHSLFSPVHNQNEAMYPSWVSTEIYGLILLWGRLVLWWLDSLGINGVTLYFHAFRWREKRPRCFKVGERESECLAIIDLAEPWNSKQKDIKIEVLIFSDFLLLSVLLKTK